MDVAQRSMENLEGRRRKDAPRLPFIRMQGQEAVELHSYMEVALFLR